MNMIFFIISVCVLAQSYLATMPWGFGFIIVVQGLPHQKARDTFGAMDLRHVNEVITMKDIKTSNSEYFTTLFEVIQAVNLSR